MKKDIAIITGGGREFVRLLLYESYIDEILIIARNMEKLNALKSEFGEKVIIFSAGLSEFEQIKALEEIIAERNINIKFLINNAGFGKSGYFDNINIKEYMNMMHPNAGTVVAMCLICIPFMDIRIRDPFRHGAYSKVLPDTTNVRKMSQKPALEYDGQALHDLAARLSQCPKAP